jgi:DNA end-binding protein Ku
LNELKLPSEGAAGLAERELSMAAQLVDAMSEPWNPDQYQDTFTARVMALVEEKVRTGHIETVVRPEAGPAGAGLAEVIDFTELLRRSLQKKEAGHTEKAAAEVKNAPKSADSEVVLPKRSKKTGDKQ